MMQPKGPSDQEGEVATTFILISRNCCIDRNLISSLPVPSLDTWKKHDNRKPRLKINTGGIIFGYTCQLTPKRLTHLKTY
jgi:hypothetical protein